MRMGVTLGLGRVGRPFQWRGINAIELVARGAVLQDALNAEVDKALITMRVARGAAGGMDDGAR